MPCFAIVFGIPIVGEFDERRLAGRAPLALLDLRLVLGGREKHQGIAVLVVDPATDFFQPELIAVKIQRIVEIAHAQHRMQISHGSTPPSTARHPAAPARPLWDISCLRPT